MQHSKTVLTYSRSAIFALEDDLSSFSFTITEPTATIAIPVLDDILEEADQEFSYSLEAGVGYTVDPDGETASFTVTDGVEGGVGPSVSVTAEPTTLLESEQTAITITFTLDEPPPPEGVLVYLNGDVPRAVAEFDVNASNPRDPEDEISIEGPVVTGGNIAGTNELASAVLFRITEQTATLTVPVFEDDVAEGLETFTYTLENGETYEVNPDASQFTISIDDSDGTEPSPEPPTEGPVISLQTITATFNGEQGALQDTILTPELVESLGEQSGSSQLILAFRTEGEIPEDGLEVIINSDIALNDYISNLTSRPLTVGGQVLGAVYNPETGDPTGLRVRIDSPNTLVALRFANKEEPETDGPEDATFTIESGEGYSVNSEMGSSTVTFYDSLETAPLPETAPQVSLTVSETALVESVGNTTTLTFNVDGEVPSDGILVYVNSTSGNFGDLGEFDVFNAEVSGGAVPFANFSASGFYFKVLEDGASITLAAFDETTNPEIEEGIVEGIQSFTFEVVESPGYTINPEADSISLTIADNPDSKLQVSYTIEPVTLIESETTVGVHTFSLSSPPPEEGVTISVSAPMLAEFDLESIEVIGGEIVSVNEGLDGFEFKLTSQTATINLPVAADGETEGLETATFTVEAGDSYQVNPEASGGTFNLVDSADQVPPPTEVLEPNDTIPLALDTKLSSAYPELSFTSSINHETSNSYALENGRLYVDFTEDVDFYKVELAAGDTVRLDIDAEQIGSDLDPVLRLFDAEGNQLAQSDDDGAPDEAFVAEADSYVEYTAVADGSYYVGVSSFPNGEFDFDNNPYEPFEPASGTGRSSGEYTLNLSVNTEIAASPTVIEPGTGEGPTVSLASTPGTFDGDDNLLASTLVQSLDDGASILTLGLTVDGAIPEGGLEVILDSDINLGDYFEIGGQPFSPGGEVIGAVYQEKQV